MTDRADDERERLEHRLTVLDALCAAQDRRAEVVTAVGSAESRDDAVREVVRLLGLADEQAAGAVLDQQLSSWTRQERDRKEQVRAEVRAELTALRAHDRQD